ncbi:MAG TPA: hypothetical protein VGV89_01245 [Thermoplasmata archaeon]|nr:hypothetical protein [Thermoplasmata archaeon]
MPAKVAAARPRTDPNGAEPAPDAPRYRRPGVEEVRWAAQRALVRPARPFASQAALRRAMIPLLRRKDPLYALGGRRMRSLLLEVPGLKLRVRFAERPTRRPLARCPVCGSAVRPIRNRTLLGDQVTLGYRCGRCGYWTHLKRRVPVRYQFVPTGTGGGVADGLARLVSRRRSG